VRQKVVANLSRLNELQAGSLDRLSEHLMRFSRRQWLLEKARQIEARHAKTWEPVLIFRRLWEELGLKTSFARLLDGTTVQTDFVDGRHYLARTELIGRAEVAFRAVGVRPPLHVTGMPRA
jgi:hypothetical protein